MFYTLMMIVAHNYAIKRSTERCKMFESPAIPKSILLLELQNHQRLTEQRELLITALSCPEIEAFAAKSDIELAA